ncbi:MAG: NUDIX domain-containing protein [Clostridia bacterium]|nr:NUDIX domain-containing protein [Clostridia bacterium]
MIFKEVIGVQNFAAGVNIIFREAVRAVIINGDKLLMVHNNKGDYKFPGGGLEKGEDQSAALLREVQEETGYRINVVKEKIGIVIERRNDKHRDNTLFEMTSYYYICEVSDDKGFQELDDYEADLDFKSLWINIDEAIKKNDKIITEKEDKNPWVIRELYVLKQLKKFFFNS